MELAGRGVALLVMERCKARFFCLLMFDCVMYSELKLIILCEVGGWLDQMVRDLMVYFIAKVTRPLNL